MKICQNSFAALVNKLVPWCAWLLSSALEVLRLRLRLRLRSLTIDQWTDPFVQWTLPEGVAVSYSLTTMCHNKSDWRSPPHLSRLETCTLVRALHQKTYQGFRLFTGVTVPKRYNCSLCRQWQKNGSGYCN